ncbi:hypothetical protein GCM10009092_23030 [Bowmanella denitrificans]|uniref:Transposase n=1 Tax=Bowmanella denitrificans TaxID=366582 RepID=A0ABP3H0P5_9ALTE
MARLIFYLSLYINTLRDYFGLIHGKSIPFRGRKSADFSSPKNLVSFCNQRGLQLKAHSAISSIYEQLKHQAGIFENTFLNSIATLSAPGHLGF